MGELIKITETNGKKVVSARELHSFIEATERFSAWMLRQLQYGFVRDVDFVGCKVFNTLANQELEDYALTLDTAKHFAMMQRNEKGMQARNYFIECEKQLYKPLTPLEVAKQLVLSLEAQDRMQLQLAEQAPKIAVYELAMSSNSTIDIGEFVRVSQLGYGRNTLFKKLRDMGILMKNNVPYENYITDGYFTCIEIPITISQQTEIKIKTLVTQKGVDYLIKKLK